MTENNLVAVIEKAAVDPNVDVDKMERLIEMQERIMSKQAEIDFNNAMTDMDLPSVEKNRKNEQTNSMYADLKSIQKTIDPVLKEAGFKYRWTHEYKENTVGTTCILYHRAGHSIEAYAEYEFDESGIKGSKNKTRPHASASAKTYGKRDSLCSVLGINITDDDDGNAAGSVPITDKQKEALVALLQDVKDIEAYQKSFLDYMKVESIDVIPQKDYYKASNAINSKLKQQTKEVNNESL